MLREADRWAALPWHRAARLPTDFPEHGPDHMRAWTSAEVELPARLAVSLARNVLGPTHATLPEVVLAALGQVLTEWAGGPVGIRTVNNGRSMSHPAVNGGPAAPVLPSGAARTVGWFSAHGLLLGPREDAIDADHVDRVRRAARLMPNSGLGIGLLHWDPPRGCDHAAIRRAWGCAQVMYNFMGSPGGGGLRPPRAR